MKIIKFTCHECNMKTPVGFPPREIENLNKALEHIKDFPNHEVVIFEPEDQDYDDD